MRCCPGIFFPVHISLMDYDIEQAGGFDFEKTNSDVQGIQFAVASKPPLQAAVVVSCY